MKDTLIKDYPYAEDKIFVLTNGFDMKDIPNKTEPYEIFTITYLGTFGGTRSPIPFLEAFSELIKNGDMDKKNISVKFVGSGDKIVEKYIHEKGLDDIIEQTKRLPQKEAIEIAYKSQLLLLIEFSDSFPQKIFEYLASGVPILTIIGSGELKGLIEGNSDEYYICSQEKKDISDAILRAYKCWKNKEKHGKGKKWEKFMEEFNRKKLSKDLSHILSDVITDDSSGFK